MTDGYYEFVLDHANVERTESDTPRVDPAVSELAFQSANTVLTIEMLFKRPKPSPDVGIPSPLALMSREEFDRHRARCLMKTATDFKAAVDRRYGPEGDET